MLVVVLPFVPVMPTTRSAVDGSPLTAAASGPSASRVSSTTSWTTAPAPAVAQRMVDEQRRCACGDGGRGERVAVVVLAAQAGVHPLWLRPRASRG